MKAHEFDKDFNDNKYITGALDLKKAYRPDLEPKRVNIDFPIWMLDELDREANRIGVTRQSIVKLWISEQLKKKSGN
jgi:hypothetical protein